MVNCLWPTSRRTCAKVASIAVVPRAPLTTEVTHTLKVSTPNASVPTIPASKPHSLLRRRGVGVELASVGVMARVDLRSCPRR